MKLPRKSKTITDRPTIPSGNFLPRSKQGYKRVRVTRVHGIIPKSLKTANQASPAGVKG